MSWHRPWIFFEVLTCLSTGSNTPSVCELSFPCIFMVRFLLMSSSPHVLPSTLEKTKIPLISACSVGNRNIHPFMHTHRILDLQFPIVISSLVIQWLLPALFIYLFFLFPMSHSITLQYIIYFFIIWTCWCPYMWFIRLISQTNS